MSNSWPRWKFWFALWYLLLTLPLVVLFVASDRLQQTATRLILKALFEFRPATVVFCGDSNTAALPQSLPATAWGRLKIMNLAVRGAKVSQMLQQLEEASAISTQFVVVMAGTNDLGGSSDDDIVSSWKILFEFRKAPPMPHMIIVSIPLQLDSSQDERIYRLNHRLRDLAGRYQWIFVDANAVVFNADIPRQNLLRDQVHFSVLGYQRWFGVVMLVANQNQSLSRQILQ